MALLPLASVGAESPAFSRAADDSFTNGMRIAFFNNLLVYSISKVKVS
jgi:hypothetical protein